MISEDNEQSLAYKKNRYEHKIRMIDETLNTLSGAFEWKHSYRGFEYWSSVYDELIAEKTRAKEELNDVLESLSRAGDE